MQGRILTYLLGCLNLLLLFLAAFWEKLDLPLWLQWSGKLHPLLLHFPLALLLVMALAQWLRPAKGGPASSMFSFLAGIAASTSVLSALSGLFLSGIQDHDPDLLTRHMWLGTGTSITAFLIWYARDIMSRNKVLLTMALPLLILTGHYGASLTHGVDYLSPPADSDGGRPAITDSTRIFSALIQPLLAAKCQACHNEKKAKGELIMTSLQSLLKGGKNGPIWVAGDPINSHIMQRVLLDEADKKHMPPRGKPQLSAQELKLLERWIAEGADTLKRFNDYATTDSFRIFLNSYIPSGISGRTYTFKAADEKTIASLRSPYCDISSVASGSPALAVRFMIRSGFNAAHLGKLRKIAGQVVEINLTDMPVKDEDLSALSAFTNLETLILNGTSIQGKGLKELSALPQLTHLALSGTGIGPSALGPFLERTKVKRIYCWNTGVTANDLPALLALNPGIAWDLGSHPNPGEVLRLTPPQFVERDGPIMSKGDTVFLKHPMPGVNMHYTLDGSAPDSLGSSMYARGIAIFKTSRIRAIACREGWLTSDTAEKLIFMRSVTPVAVRLLSVPDEKYRAKGAIGLTDGKTGEIVNLGEEWLGFHGKACEMIFHFEGPVALREAVVSTLRRTGPHIFPPARLELWAGNDSLSMKKISSLVPQQPDHHDRDRIEAQVLKSEGRWRYYGIRLYPLGGLPSWHEAKGKKAWIFLDEVFFEQ